MSRRSSGSHGHHHHQNNNNNFNYNKNNINNNPPPNSSRRASAAHAFQNRPASPRGPIEGNGPSSEQAFHSRTSRFRPGPPNPNAHAHAHAYPSHQIPPNNAHQDDTIPVIPAAANRPPLSSGAHPPSRWSGQHPPSHLGPPVQKRIQSSLSVRGPLPSASTLTTVPSTVPPTDTSAIVSSRPVHPAYLACRRYQPPPQAAANSTGGGTGGGAAALRSPTEADSFPLLSKLFLEQRSGKLWKQIQEELDLLDESLQHLNMPQYTRNAAVELALTNNEDDDENETSSLRHIGTIQNDREDGQQQQPPTFDDIEFDLDIFPNNFAAPQHSLLNDNDMTTEDPVSSLQPPYTSNTSQLDQLTQFMQHDDEPFFSTLRTDFSILRTELTTRVNDSVQPIKHALQDELTMRNAIAQNTYQSWQQDNLAWDKQQEILLQEYTAQFTQSQQQPQHQQQHQQHQQPPALESSSPTHQGQPSIIIPAQSHESTTTSPQNNNNTHNNSLDQTQSVLPNSSTDAIPPQTTSPTNSQPPSSSNQEQSSIQQQEQEQPPSSPVHVPAAASESPSTNNNIALNEPAPQSDDMVDDPTPPKTLETTTQTSNIEHNTNPPAADGAAAPASPASAEAPSSELSTSGLVTDPTMAVTSAAVDAVDAAAASDGVAAVASNEVAAVVVDNPPSNSPSDSAAAIVSATEGASDGRAGGDDSIKDTSENNNNNNNNNNNQVSESPHNQPVDTGITTTATQLTTEMQDTVISPPAVLEVAPKHQDDNNETTTTTITNSRSPKQSNTSSISSSEPPRPSTTPKASSTPKGRIPLPSQYGFAQFVQEQRKLQIGIDPTSDLTTAAAIVPPAPPTQNKSRSKSAAAAAAAAQSNRDLMEKIRAQVDVHDVEFGHLTHVQPNAQLVQDKLVDMTPYFSLSIPRVIVDQVKQELSTLYANRSSDPCDPEYNILIDELDDIAVNDQNNPQLQKQPLFAITCDMITPQAAAASAATGNDTLTFSTPQARIMTQLEYLSNRFNFTPSATTSSSSTASSSSSPSSLSLVTQSLANVWSIPLDQISQAQSLFMNKLQHLEEALFDMTASRPAASTRPQSSATMSDHDDEEDTSNDNHNDNDNDTISSIIEASMTSSTVPPPPEDENAIFLVGLDETNIDISSDSQVLNKDASTQLLALYHHQHALHQQYAQATSLRDFSIYASLLFDLNSSYNQLPIALSDANTLEDHPFTYAFDSRNDPIARAAKRRYKRAQAVFTSQIEAAKRSTQHQVGLPTDSDDEPGNDSEDDDDDDDDDDDYLDDPDLYLLERHAPQFSSQEPHVIDLLHELPVLAYYTFGARIQRYQTARRLQFQIQQQQQRDAANAKLLQRGAQPSLLSINRGQKPIGTGFNIKAILADTPKMVPPIFRVAQKNMQPSVINNGVISHLVSSGEFRMDSFRFDRENKLLKLKKLVQFEKKTSLFERIATASTSFGVSVPPALCFNSNKNKLIGLNDTPTDFLSGLPLDEFSDDLALVHSTPQAIRRQLIRDQSFTDIDMILWQKECFQALNTLATSHYSTLAHTLAVITGCITSKQAPVHTLKQNKPIDNNNNNSQPNSTPEQTLMSLVKSFREDAQDKRSIFPQLMHSAEIQHYLGTSPAAISRSVAQLQFPRHNEPFDLFSNLLSYALEPSFAPLLPSLIGSPAMNQAHPEFSPLRRLTTPPVQYHPSVVTGCDFVDPYRINTTTSSHFYFQALEDTFARVNAFSSIATTRFVHLPSRRQDSSAPRVFAPCAPDRLLYPSKPATDADASTNDAPASAVTEADADQPPPDSTPREPSAFELPAVEDSAFELPSFVPTAAATAASVPPTAAPTPAVAVTDTPTKQPISTNNTSQLITSSVNRRSRFGRFSPRSPFSRPIVRTGPAGQRAVLHSRTTVTPPPSSVTGPLVLWRQFCALHYSYGTKPRQTEPPTNLASPGYEQLQNLAQRRQRAESSLRQSALATNTDPAVKLDNMLVAMRKRAVARKKRVSSTSTQHPRVSIPTQPVRSSTLPTSQHQIALASGRSSVALRGAVRPSSLQLCENAFFENTTPTASARGLLVSTIPLHQSYRLVDEKPTTTTTKKRRRTIPAWVRSDLPLVASAFLRNVQAQHPILARTSSQNNTLIAAFPLHLNIIASAFASLAHNRVLSHSLIGVSPPHSIPSNSLSSSVRTLGSIDTIDPYRQLPVVKKRFQFAPTINTISSAASPPPRRQRGLDGNVISTHILPSDDDDHHLSLPPPRRKIASNTSSHTNTSLVVASSNGQHNAHSHNNKNTRKASVLVQWSNWFPYKFNRENIIFGYAQPTTAYYQEVSSNILFAQFSRLATNFDQIMPAVFLRPIVSSFDININMNHKYIAAILSGHVQLESLNLGAQQIPPLFPRESSDPASNFLIQSIPVPTTASDRRESARRSKSLSAAMNAAKETHADSSADALVFPHFDLPDLPQLTPLHNLSFPLHNQQQYHKKPTTSRKNASQNQLYRTLRVNTHFGGDLPLACGLFGGSWLTLSASSSQQTSNTTDYVYCDSNGNLCDRDHADYSVFSPSQSVIEALHLEASANTSLLNSSSQIGLRHSTSQTSRNRSSFVSQNTATAENSKALDRYHALTSIGNISIPSFAFFDGWIVYDAEGMPLAIPPNTIDDIVIDKDIAYQLTTQ